MPQFDSGAAEQIGRFSEGLLLRLLHLILSFAIRAVLSHSGRCFSATRRTSGRGGSFAGIGAAYDVPIASRLVARREAEDCFERDMPVKSAIVAKNEFACGAGRDTCRGSIASSTRRPGESMAGQHVPPSCRRRADRAGNRSVRDKTRGHR